MNAWEVLVCLLLLLAACTVCLLRSASWQEPQATVNLTSQVPEQVHDNDFVSSQSCRSCHPEQHASWHRTFHRTMTQLALPTAIVPSADFEQERQLKINTVIHTLKRKGDQFWVNTPDPDEEYRLLKLYEFVSTTPEIYRILSVPHPDWTASLASLANPAIGLVWLREEIDPRNPASAPVLVDRQVVLTTGSHNMQIYWLPSKQKDEPLRLFPWIYQIKAQRWMPYEDSFVVHSDFGRPPVSWNNNCIACHTVNGDFTYLNGPENSQVKSTVAEYGISCEACHGPGKDHVRKHQNPFARYRQHMTSTHDETIVNPAKGWHVKGSQICGQCHSSFHKYEPYRAGENVNQARAFVQPREAQNPNSPFYDNFWPDGTIRIGGREYLGLTVSGCYQNGKMSCMSCHSMHESNPQDQLAAKMETNHACLQCHEQFQNTIPEHTHHAADSSGSKCYNCHMPHTSYALLGAIRNHRISSPNAANHLATGHPNACNLCHLDKTLQWTAEHLTQWYDQPAVPLDPTQQVVSASLQMLLSGDAVQRIVIAWHMGWEPAWKASGKDWQAPLLAQVLQDPYSSVRFVAHKSMEKLPNYQRWQGPTDYDFIAPHKEREQFQNEFLRRWQATRPKNPANPAAVLRNGDGTLQMDAILKLLSERDNRMILLAE